MFAIYVINFIFYNLNRQKYYKYSIDVFEVVSWDTADVRASYSNILKSHLLELEIF